MLSRSERLWLKICSHAANPRGILHSFFAKLMRRFNLSEQLFRDQTSSLKHSFIIIGAVPIVIKRYRFTKDKMELLRARECGEAQAAHHLRDLLAAAKKFLAEIRTAKKFTQRCLEKMSCV